MSDLKKEMIALRRETEEEREEGILGGHWSPKDQAMFLEAMQMEKRVLDQKGEWGPDDEAQLELKKSQPFQEVFSKEKRLEIMPRYKANVIKNREELIKSDEWSDFDEIVFNANMSESRLAEIMAGTWSYDKQENLEYSL